MIRFNVSGEYLDLPADLSLQFKKSNVLFAFDKMECERSTSFDIPATPQNDRIFALAKWTQSSGTGMRRRYEAQMQASMVTKDGYLYVDAYADGKYKAIFVTGELLGLLRIKDAGKIADIIQTSETTTWNSYPYTPTNGKNTLWACVRYATDGAHNPYPSVRLQPILDLAMQNLGVNWTPPGVPAYVRFIPEELNGVETQVVRFEGSPRSMPDDDTYPVCYYSSIDGVESILFNTSDAKVQRWVGSPVVYNYRGKVRQLVARQELKITFPSDWDDDLYIGYFLDGDSPFVGEFSFYGGRSFDEFHRVTGESLKGRTVTIPTGGKFTIISINDYIDEETSSGRERGWGFQGVWERITLEGGDIESGDVVRLQDNLPDITVTDLLKTFAALSGKQLYYTDNGGVTFDDLDFSAWGVLDLTGKVISQKDMERKFGDYVRNNIVQFETDESVPSSSRVKIAYTIDNDNLEESKDLQTIPFSEGISYGSAGTRTLLQTDGANALGDADTTEAYMLRAQLLKNANLQSLCDASTAVTLQVSMSLLEYEMIQAKTAIYYDGIKYVWTEAQYSKGVVTLKLSKINA